MSISFHIHTCRVITIKILRYLIISAHVAPLFFHIWMDWNIHTKNFFNCLPHSFITKKTKVRAFLQDRHHSRLICSFHQYPARTQPPPYRARLRNPAPPQGLTRGTLCPSPHPTPVQFIFHIPMTSHRISKFFCC